MLHGFMIKLKLEEWTIFTNLKKIILLLLILFEPQNAKTNLTPSSKIFGIQEHSARPLILVTYLAKAFLNN